MRAKLLTIIATVASSMLLGSCSKDDNYAVDISFTNTPILINQSFQYQEQDSAGAYVTISVSPTYFRVGVKITNNGTSTITIQGLTFSVDVPSTDSNGSTKTQTATCTIAPSATQTSTYLAEIPAGKSRTLPSTEPGEYSKLMYCTGIPFAEDATDQDFKTTGTLRLEGWIGTHDEATGRLNTALKSFDFS